MIAATALLDGDAGVHSITKPVVGDELQRHGYSSRVALTDF